MKLTEKALRELDAWIAEHVMGFEKHDNPDMKSKTGNIKFWVRPDSKDLDGLELNVFRGEPYQIYGQNEYSHEWKFYNPTTDPAAAMVVLETCISKCDGNLEIIAVSNGQFRLSEEGSGHVWGETLPLAVCKFCRVLFDKSKR